MNHAIYFADKSLFFRHLSDPVEGVVVEEPITRAKILKFFETSNALTVSSADPDASFAAFSQAFRPVAAAGGIVVDPAERMLMIRRNGRWDLPKGHVEAGEPTEVCAVREVLEETGVETEVAAPLCATWHAYWFPKTARWELKRTHWFLLRAAGSASLTPQTEEGIEQVVWCLPEAFAAHAAGSFPTIRRVAEALSEFIIQNS